MMIFREEVGIDKLYRLSNAIIIFHLIQTVLAFICCLIKKNLTWGCILKWTASTLLFGPFSLQLIVPQRKYKLI
ncbi:hypothetical protein CONCODRAFT_79718 [Conidiobolus coronatus NRRL 28638]|uniref:Uncharacterized protein n=1 Tax=Conidiobolus coronatus (strain ATCC 28846 / CBS 209.66 / NRRL 28638) TaxID=796925 RepID=A0A137P0L4_CONC2|nr:hypothetical protein CONCODRAFT_79718 [Conidiobolus coronatus NRRL 28638]|eukprot:KXN68508.1 hypothetical protein CONCODRAFT_79718 [Conidiobolus coronatus NRRL 28638]